MVQFSIGRYVLDADWKSKDWDWPNASGVALRCGIRPIILRLVAETVGECEHEKARSAEGRSFRYCIMDTASVSLTRLYPNYLTNRSSSISPWVTYVTSRRLDVIKPVYCSLSVPFYTCPLCPVPSRQGEGRERREIDWLKRKWQERWTRWQTEWTMWWERETVPD